MLFSVFAMPSKVAELLDAVSGGAELLVGVATVALRRVLHMVRGGKSNSHHKAVRLSGGCLWLIVLHSGVGPFTFKVWGLSQAWWGEGQWRGVIVAPGVPNVLLRGTFSSRNKFDSV